MTEKKSIGIIGGTGKHGFGIAKKLAKDGYPIIIGSRDAERGITKANQLIEFLKDSPNRGQISGGDNNLASQADVIVLSIPISSASDLLDPIKHNLENKIIVDVMVNLKLDLLNKGDSTYDYLEKQYPTSKIVSCLKTVATKLLNSQDTIEQTDFVISDDPEALEFGLSISKLMGLQPLGLKDPVHAVTIENLVSLAIHINKTYKGSHAGFLVTNVNN